MLETKLDPHPVSDKKQHIFETSNRQNWSEVKSIYICQSKPAYLVDKNPGFVVEDFIRNISPKNDPHLFGRRTIHEDGARPATQGLRSKLKACFAIDIYVCQ